MGDKKPTLKERGVIAASAYLERQNIKVMESNINTGVIFAADGDTLVHVHVSVTRQSKDFTPAKHLPVAYKRRVKDYLAKHVPVDVTIDVRYDEITLFVIGPKRAMLQHHKAVY